MGAVKKILGLILTFVMLIWTALLMMIGQGNLHTWDNTKYLEGL